MADLNAYPPFPGFREEAFAFLRDLKANNDRDWFKERKKIYEDELKGPLECLIADVGRRLLDTDLPLTGNPKDSRFRIYRDMRFTDDPRPYKTHVSAVFDRSGSKNANGVVYVHVEPDSSFIAAGFYRPAVKYLLPVRQAIAEHPEGFQAMLDTMAARGLPVSGGDDSLTGMPRGFAAYRDTNAAPWLKWTGYLTSQDVPDDALHEPVFAEQVVELAERCTPLLTYVWDAHRTS